MLSGLSSAQHKWVLDEVRPVGSASYGDNWTVTPDVEGSQIFEENDRVVTVHPVYAIPKHAVEYVQQHFALKAGF